MHLGEDDHLCASDEAERGCDYVLRDCNRFGTQQDYLVHKHDAFVNPEFVRCSFHKHPLRLQLLLRGRDLLAADPGRLPSQINLRALSQSH